MLLIVRYLQLRDKPAGPPKESLKSKHSTFTTSSEAMSFELIPAKLQEVARTNAKFKS